MRQEIQSQRTCVGVVRGAEPGGGRRQHAAERQRGADESIGARRKGGVGELRVEVVAKRDD